MEDGPVVGIDLGVDKACVAVYEHGKVEIISNDQGYRHTPCYVAFTENERLVGESAKCQAILKPENAIYGKYSS